MGQNDHFGGSVLSEILRMAAHFSPSCLGLMGNLGNPLALFFYYKLPIFFAQEGYWRSNLLISNTD